MATDLQTIMDKLARLPAEKQRQVLDFVEKLDQPSTSDAGPASAPKAIWEIIEEVTKQVPLEAWAEMPTDGSINVDHYLYGAPKK